MLCSMRNKEFFSQRHKGHGGYLRAGYWSGQSQYRIFFGGGIITAHAQEFRA